MDSSRLPPTFPGCCLQSRRHWASASVGSDFLKLRVLEKPPALWHNVGGPVTGEELDVEHRPLTRPTSSS